MIRREKDLFILDTANTTYCFRVMSSGHLEHLYYGRSINLSAGYDPLLPKRNFIGGSELSYSKQEPHLGLEDMCLEMSSYGKGDIREAFIELVHADGNATCDFLFKEARLLNYKKPLESLPSSYQERSQEEISDHYTGLEVELWEKDYNISLILTYHVFEDCNVITRSARVVNHSDQAVFLKRIMSTQLDLDAEDYKITTFHGTWAREMERHEIKAIPGIFINDSKAGVSGNRSNPFFFLSERSAGEDHGNCYGFNLIYSGNHFAAMQVNSMGKLRILQGIHPHNFMFRLAPADSFEAPEAVMTFSPMGYNTMSQNLHYFVRHHIVRGEWRDKERPVLLNSWEANYFKFNENKLIKQAKAAKEVGVELFVLDDGWFGKRNDDTTSLGDWYVNKDKLKNGLKGLSDKVNAMGLSFGIWVEPEMVNEVSDLYTAHPDWAVTVPGRDHSLGRNQMILDLTREEVCSYVTEEMTKVFSSANITYVKWDMNRIFSDYYSTSLPSDRQQEFSHRYVLGLYQILKVLTERFPKILFESCASGGNRFDLGMLCYMPQTWASDNTDAICRAAIQTGYSYGYPMSVIGAHVSSCPNHQTLRNTSLETRFEVAAFGLLGYECNLAELSMEEKKLVEEQITFYKRHRRELQFGDYYRIKNGEAGIYQWMTVAPSGEKAFGLFLQKETKANYSFGCFKTKGLLEQKCYHMTNRQHIFNIKEFGDLINMISPIHIKKDSLAHNIIAKWKKMPGEVEDCTAYGELFNYGGVKLKQGFSGTGYNEETRLFQDYASRLYIWEAVER